MALDIAALQRVLHHQFSRYFSILPFPAKRTYTLKHGDRLRRKFKYSATLADGTNSKKVQFCEREWKEMRRAGEGREDDERDDDEKTKEPSARVGLMERN